MYTIYPLEIIKRQINRIYCMQTRVATKIQFQKKSTEQTRKVFVIPWIKVIFSRNSLSHGIYHSQVRYGTERNCANIRTFLFWELVRKEIPKIFIFRKMVRNKISLLGNGSERNFELFYLPRKSLGMELRAFSVQRNTQTSDGMNKNFCPFSVPRNNFFLGKWQPKQT